MEDISSLQPSASVPSEGGAAAAPDRRHPFKVGDDVVCIRGGSHNAGWNSKLVVGETYRVVETYDNGWMFGVNLDDPRLSDGVPPYSASRFRLASVAADAPAGTSDSE